MRTIVILFMTFLTIGCVGNVDHRMSENVFQIEHQPLMERRLNDANNPNVSSSVRDRYQANIKTQKQIKAKNFNDIFYQARKLNRREQILVDDVVTQYLQMCCKTKEDIIRLLKKNNFKVSASDRIEIKEYISAAKKTSPFIWSDTYYVEVLLEHGEMIEALAKVQSTYPPL